MLHAPPPSTFSSSTGSRTRGERGSVDIYPRHRYHLVPLVDDEVVGRGEEGRETDESAGCPDQVNRVNVSPVNGESN